MARLLSTRSLWPWSVGIDSLVFLRSASCRQPFPAAARARVRAHTAWASQRASCSWWPRWRCLLAFLATASSQTTLGPSQVRYRARLVHLRAAHDASTRASVVRARSSCVRLEAGCVRSLLRCAQTACASLTLLRCAAAESRISNLLARSKYNGRRLLGYGCARPARACCVSANKVDAAACR